MSEERLNAIEAAVARIEANMVTKADLAGMATKADLAGMATKADLAEAVAGVARNVDITAIGRQLREIQDELRVTSAIVLRLDHALPDITVQLNAMVRQQIGIIDRVHALEDGETR